MIRVGSEVFLWPREAAIRVLRESLAAVEEVDAPEDLREAVFVKAVEMLGARHVELEQMGVGVQRMQIPGNHR